MSINKTEKDDLMNVRSIWIVTVAVVALASSARATPIDLNGFLGIPPQNVTIAPDGSNAELEEGLGAFGATILAHDPFLLGPPALIIPTAEEPLLKFDYDFVEGPSNDDEFLADAYVALDEPPVHPNFEFSTTESSSGTVAFDLTPFVGDAFALEFVLVTLDTDLASTVTIFDVRLQPIPEPSTIGMFAIIAASGLSLAYLRRKRRAA